MLLNEWATKKWYTRKESLNGSLQSVTKIVQPRRSFLRCMIDLLWAFRSPSHPIQFKPTTKIYCHCKIMLRRRCEICFISQLRIAFFSKLFNIIKTAIEVAYVRFSKINKNWKPWVKDLLNLGFGQKLTRWREFLQSWNGVSFFLTLSNCALPELHVASNDASLSWFGTIWRNARCYASLLPSISQLISRL